MPVTFRNVLFIPKFERLISISQLTENENVEVLFKNQSAVLQVSGRRFVFGNRVGKMYKMNFCNFAVLSPSEKKKEYPEETIEEMCKISSGDVKIIQNEVSVPVGVPQPCDLKWENFEKVSVQPYRGTNVRQKISMNLCIQEIEC